VRAALPQIRQLDLQVSGAAPRSLGLPCGIVGLGFKQLLGAGEDPTRLLTGTTSAILCPVDSQGEVVDAFLMLFIEGRWQRGGYAVAGEAVLADKQLRKLQTAIWIDLQPRTGRGRGTGRRRQ